MDDAPIRRGLPTVYNKYGTNIAILSGDAMFTKAYEYVTYTDEKKLPLVLKVFNKTAREVCEGQQLDMNFETIQNISREQYMEMIHLKTAVLIGACMKIGAILGNASEKEVDAIYEFGLNTGMVFQLQDDLLDTFGDEKIFGKRIGDDIIDCKKTFLYIVALENLSAKDKDEFIKIYSDNNIVDSQKIKIITDFFNKANVMEECKKTMLDYHEKAIKALPNTGLKLEQQETLKEIAESMLVRNL
jgi:geranylgeranyl diphosphate synthase type II